MKGVLEEILICPDAGAELVSVPEALLEKGKGIVGDRYFLGNGTFSKRLSGLPCVQVTLIEKEQVEAFNAHAGMNYMAKDFRRNLVTAGVNLNDLVAQEFQIGSVTLRGLRLCEPCAHLARILGDEVMEHMVRKAGLRAQIISGGTIQVDDLVVSASD